MPSGRDQKVLLKCVGRNLQRIRRAAGWSQETLAEKAELHPRTIQKIEAGDMNLLITTLDRLKSALKADWEDLLGA